METIFYIVYAAFLAVMSLLAIILYAGDKKKAKKGAWRTPESVLLGFGFFGGAIGALIAMNSFRHIHSPFFFALRHYYIIKNAICSKKIVNLLKFSLALDFPTI